MTQIKHISTMKTIMLRLKKISIELNHSIHELQHYNKDNTKNWASLTTDNNQLNFIYNDLKSLEFLKDLDHIFNTAQNILDLLLTELKAID